MFLKGWRTFILNTAAPAFFVWLGLRGFDVDPETQYALTLGFMAVANLILRWLTTTAIFSAVQDPMLVAETPAGPVIAVPQTDGSTAIVAPETRHSVVLDIVPTASAVTTPAGQETVTLMSQPGSGSG